MSKCHTHTHLLCMCVMSLSLDFQSWMCLSKNIHWLQFSVIWPLVTIWCIPQFCLLWSPHAHVVCYQCRWCSICYCGSSMHNDCRFTINTPYSPLIRLPQGEKYKQSLLYTTDGVLGLNYWGELNGCSSAVEIPFSSCSLS